MYARGRHRPRGRFLNRSRFHVARFKGGSWSGRHASSPLEDLDTHRMRHPRVPIWEERALLQQTADERRWRAALFAVVCSLLLAIFVRNLSVAPQIRLLLVDGAAFSLYLTVGAWANGPPGWRRVLVFSCAYLVLVTGILLGAVIIQRATSAPDSYSKVGLALSWAMMIVPSWVILGYGLLRHPSEALGRGLGAAWWLRAVLWGLFGGVFVTVYLGLSAYFSGLFLTRLQMPTLLFAHQLVYVLGIRCAGEELLFRGAVFQILHERRGKGFWAATMVSLPLNLGIYVATMPSFRSPAMLAVLLLAPSVMIVTNSALYLRQRSLVSPLVSNGLLHVASLAVGAQ